MAAQSATPAAALLPAGTKQKPNKNALQPLLEGTSFCVGSARSGCENAELLVGDVQVSSTCFLNEFDQCIDGLTHDSSFDVRDALQSAENMHLNGFQLRVNL